MDRSNYRGKFEYIIMQLHQTVQIFFENHWCECKKNEFDIEHPSLWRSNVLQRIFLLAKSTQQKQNIITKDALIVYGAQLSLDAENDSNQFSSVLFFQHVLHAEGKYAWIMNIYCSNGTASIHKT